MRVAIIKDGPLLPIKDGASYKIYNLALEYQRNGLDLFFILIDRGWVKEDEILHSGIKNFILIPPEDAYNNKNLTLLLNQLKIDAIQTNIPELLMKKSGEWSNFKRVFDSHDVLYEQSEQRNLSKSEIGMEKFIDYTACSIADIIFCCSERDKQAYIDLGVDEKKLIVIKNGVDFQNNKKLMKEDYVVFLGHIYYQPNYEAVLRIFEIAKETPEINYKVVGNFPENLESRAPSNVEMLGFVKDVEPILLRAKLALSPLDIGSGSSVKVVHYLSTGLKVLSTSVGARGLEDLHKYLLIEDDYSKYPEIIRSELKSQEIEIDFKELVRNYDYKYIGRLAADVIVNK